MVPSDCSLSKVICKSEQDQIYRERAERHSGDEKLFDAVTRCFQTRGKKRKGGQKPNFLPYPDKPVAKAFHAAPNHEKYAIAQRFQSSHHKELALAVIWDLCPESLPSAERARIDDLVEESWRCDSLPGRTFSSAKEDIQRALAGSPSKRDLAIITDYKSVLSLLEQKGVRYYG